MLPLVVGREVEEGFRSYLTFGFESSNPLSSGFVRTFAREPRSRRGLERQKRQDLAPLLFAQLAANQDTTLGLDRETGCTPLDVPPGCTPREKAKSRVE